MDRPSFSAANCSVAGALAIVGEKWTLLVLRESFYGLRRFEGLLQAIGCARNVLSDRLARLVEHELLERIAYRDDGQRERYEYRLTSKGRELFPVLLALMHWGDRWLPREGGPPVVVRHQGCGAPLQVEVRCRAGHGPLAAKDASPVPGPGARRVRRSTRSSASRQAR